MRALILVLLVTVLSFVQGQSVLQKIQNQISSSGRINSQSVGPQVAAFLNIALHETDLPAVNISYKLTANSLTVICQSVIWDATVDADFYFFLDSASDVQLAFSFSVIGTVQELFSIVTAGTVPIPNSVQELKGNGTWEISFSSSTSAPVPIEKGVTLKGTAEVVNGTLLSILHWFAPKTTEVEVSTSLLIPIFSAQPADVTIVATASGNIPLTKALTVTSLQMTVNVPTSIEVEIDLQATFNGPKNEPEVLTFKLSGQAIPDQPQFILEGDMTGTWAHPFHLNWLTLSSAQGKLVLGNDNTQALTLTALGAVSFATGQVTIDVSFEGPEFTDVLLAMENIQVSKKIKDIYSDVSGQSGPALAQVNVTGTASVAISTYNTGTYNEGFTIIVDATITEGNLLKAAKVLNSAAAPSSRTYVSSLYIPIFTGLGVDFTLKETSAFQSSKHIKCDDYSLTIDASSDSQVTIQADLEISTSDGQDLKVTVTGQWQESAGEVTFNGNLNSPWNNPLKLKWLDIESGSINFALGGSEVVQLTLKASAQLAWDASGPVDVYASIGGEDLTDVVFSVSGMPIHGDTLNKICYYLLGMSEAPPVIKSLNPKGTASVTISTFDSPVGNEGFTLKAAVNLQNTGELYKISRFFNADPTSFNFDMSLYVNLFGASPSMQFSLTEQGSFNFRKNIVVNSYSLYVDVSENPSIQVSTDMSITLKRQPNPLDFSLSVNWQDLDSLTLAGQMTSTFPHPFGQQWLNITSLSASLTLSAPAGLQSLSFSGDAAFHFGVNTGTASVSLQMADDFMDTTLSATVNNQWTLEEMATTVLGKEPGDLVKDVESKGAVSATITISTDSGISFTVNGQITGDLQSKVKHVTYWWDKNNENVTFAVSLDLPIFSSNPLAIALSLSYAEELPLTKHLWFESIDFSIAIAPFAISLDAKVKGEFKDNPTLFFEVSGSFSQDGGVLMWGAMEGTWLDPFGIKGWSLSNVILEFGFNPSMCAVDACISDLGVGAQFPIGSKVIKFDGNVAAPDFWNMFLSGSLTNKNAQLGVIDVINDWNKVNPNKPVPTKLIPDSWGIYEASFYFAPEDGQFGPIHYSRGFGVTGGIIILDMPVFLSLNCTDDAGFSCNFAFDADITVKQFTDMIKKELHLMYPDMTDFDFFSVHDAQLTQWSQQNSAAGVHPRWQIGLTVWDKPHNLDFNVQQYELAGSFHDFFKQWLAHIF